MGTHMKTTVEIADGLLERSRKLARREGTSLRALLEEGLDLALKRRSAQARRAPPILPTYGTGGLSTAFENASWARLRDEIHGLPPETDEAR